MSDNRFTADDIEDMQEALEALETLNANAGVLLVDASFTSRDGTGFTVTRDGDSFTLEVTG